MQIPFHRYECIVRGVFENFYSHGIDVVGVSRYGHQFLLFEKKFLVLALEQIWECEIALMQLNDCYPLDILRLIHSYYCRIVDGEYLDLVETYIPRHLTLINDLEYLHYWSVDQPAYYTFAYLNVSVINTMYNPVGHNLVSKAYKNRRQTRAWKKIQKLGPMPMELEYALLYK